MFKHKKLGKKLRFAWDKTWQSGDEVGNSASATVPLTIAKNAAAMLITDKTSKILFSGYGGGLSASAGIVTLDPSAYYKLFQKKKKK